MTILPEQISSQSLLDTVDKTVKALILAGVIWLISTSNENNTQILLMEQRLVNAEAQYRMVKEEMNVFKRSAYSGNDFSRDIRPLELSVEYIKKEIAEIKEMLKK